MLLVWINRLLPSPSRVDPQGLTRQAGQGRKDRNERLIAGQACVQKRAPVLAFGLYSSVYGRVQGRRKTIVEITETNTQSRNREGNRPGDYKNARIARSKKRVRVAPTTVKRDDPLYDGYTER